MLLCFSKFSLYFCSFNKRVLVIDCMTIIDLVVESGIFLTVVVIRMDSAVKFIKENQLSTENEARIPF